MPSNSGPQERRRSKLLRVSFVQRCLLTFDPGGSYSALIVNLDILGVYVACDQRPQLGQGLLCSFRIPGNELDISIKGVIVWVNPHQQHPIHSLPPGFGIKFIELSPENQRRIEQVIQDTIARLPSMPSP